MPRKSERPVIIKFLIEFMFVNWRNERPTAAAKRKEHKKICEWIKGLMNNIFIFFFLSYQRGQRGHNAMLRKLGLVWTQTQHRICLFEKDNKNFNKITWGKYTRIVKSLGARVYPIRRRRSWSLQILEQHDGFLLLLTQEVLHSLCNQNHM